MTERKMRLPFPFDAKGFAREARQPSQMDNPAQTADEFTLLEDASPFDAASPFEETNPFSSSDVTDGEQDLYGNTFGDTFAPPESSQPPQKEKKKTPPFGARVNAWASQAAGKGRALTEGLFRKSSKPPGPFEPPDSSPIQTAPFQNPQDPSGTMTFDDTPAWGQEKPDAPVDSPSHENITKETVPLSANEDDDEPYDTLLDDLRRGWAAFRKRLPGFKPKVYTLPEPSYAPEEDNIKSPTLREDIEKYIARERDFGETQREYDRMREYINSVNTSAKLREGDIPTPSNLREVRSAENELFDMIRQIDRQNEEQRGRIGIYEPPPEPDPYNYRGINDTRQNYDDIEAATFSMQPRVSFESEQRIDPGRRAAEQALARQWEETQNTSSSTSPEVNSFGTKTMPPDDGFMSGFDDEPPFGEPSFAPVQPPEEWNAFSENSNGAADAPLWDAPHEEASNRRRFGRRAFHPAPSDTSREPEAPVGRKERFVSHMPSEEEKASADREMAEDFAAHFPDAVQVKDTPRKARRVAVRRRNAADANMDDR